MAFGVFSAAMIAAGREFFRSHRVSRGAFQAALALFGAQSLAEYSGHASGQRRKSY